MSEAVQSATVSVVGDDIQRASGPIIPTPRESLVESTTSRGDVSAVEGKDADDAGICYPGVRYAMERLALKGLVSS